MAADASEYLGEGSKMNRVLAGLRSLREGRKAGSGQPALPPDREKLASVASELAELLVEQRLVDEETAAEAMDGDTDDERAPRSEPDAQPNTSSEAAPESETAETKAENPRAVLVVHGQDAAATRAIFDWLRAVDLRPQEWSKLVKESGTASPFVGEVLEKAFQRAQAVVVLFTPDEDVRLREELSKGTSPWRLQARPNVLFEAGMALATHDKRTVLVILGGQELPSNLAGRHYVKLDRVEALHDLAQRLSNAGCPVDLSGSDWLDIDRFLALTR